MKNQYMNDGITGPPKDKITNADNGEFDEKSKTSEAGKKTEKDNLCNEDVISEKVIVNCEINPTDQPLK